MSASSPGGSPRGRVLSYRRAAITAVVGAALIVAFTIVNLIDYRLMENRGEEALAPAWVVLGTYVGVALFVLGVVVMVILRLGRVVRR